MRVYLEHELAVPGKTLCDIADGFFTRCSRIHTATHVGNDLEAHAKAVVRTGRRMYMWEGAVVRWEYGCVGVGAGACMRVSGGLAGWGGGGMIRKCVMCN